MGPQNGQFWSQIEISWKIKKPSKTLYCRRFLVVRPLEKCIFSMLKPLKKTIAKKVGKKNTKNQMQIQKNPSKPPTYRFFTFFEGPKSVQAGRVFSHFFSLGANIASRPPPRAPKTPQTMIFDGFGMDF